MQQQQQQAQHCNCLPTDSQPSVPCRAANLVLKTYDDLRARRSSKHSAALVVKSSQDSLKAKWGTVQHLYNKHLEVTAGDHPLLLCSDPDRNTGSSAVHSLLLCLVKKC